jgi:serine/threonine-protein kinase RsbT
MTKVDATESLDIVFESDVFTLANRVRAWSLELGLTPFQAGLMACASSEIATNVFRYAGCGIAEIKRSENGKGIAVKIEDFGGGIADVELAMTDGYTTCTTKSLGLGLGAAKRSCDEMTINTGATGTTVILKKYLDVDRADIDIGVVSLPAEGEHYNGDGYVIVKYEGDKAFIAVLDGAGKGIKAANAVKTLSTFLKTSYKLPLDQLAIQGHEILLKSDNTRAVEVAFTRVTPEKIETLLLGNVSAYINEPETYIPIQNGSLGLSIPQTINVHHFDRRSNLSVIIHTDGIAKVDSKEAFRVMNSVQSTAYSIFNHYALSDDDATVMVVAC